MESECKSKKISNDNYGKYVIEIYYFSAKIMKMIKMLKM